MRFVVAGAPGSLAAGRLERALVGERSLDRARLVDRGLWRAVIGRRSLELAVAGDGRACLSLALVACRRQPGRLDCGGVPAAAPQAHPPALWLAGAGQLTQRLGGGILLGALLAGPHPAPYRKTVDHRLEHELARVRRADRLDQPVGDRAARLGELFLQLGLEVDVAAFGKRDVFGERFDDGGTHHVETVGEVDGPDEGLGHVGEDVLVADELVELGLLVAGAEAAHEGRQSQSGGDLGAGGAADDVGAQPREAAFGVLGKAAIQLGRHGEAEHAVAEKLETLVRVATLRHP